MVKLLYNIFISLYPLVAKIVSPFNKKAALWLEGRKHWKQPFAPSRQAIWFHAASVGEFEQAKPIIEQIRSQNVPCKIMVSFFSPSGYEANKKYSLADAVIYLPMDSQQNANDFLDHYQPTLAVFIKYEFWYHYLKTLHNRNTPAVLVSAVFRKDQPFFKSYGGFFRKMLHTYQHIFVQHETSKKLLSKINIDHVSVSGDTRFDRVKKIAGTFSEIEIFKQLSSSKKVIVAGSTWLDDDKLLSTYANQHPEVIFIIAPHEVDEKRIQECTELYNDSILFSNISSRKNEHVIIIDSIGLLSRLYHYATIAYVGGGFTKDGIHNTLEAAVYYKPVVIGSNYHKYKEAVELVKNGGAFSVKNETDLSMKIEELFAKENYYEKATKAAGNYVEENTGATEKIMNYIQENRLLTN
jgi:3-deoxy-D-manno-octulosonic-acid transferase